MIGAITQAEIDSDPDIAALSRIVCAGCEAFPLGVGFYAAKSRRIPGFLGGPGRYETRLFHVGCRGLWRCSDQIGLRDEPICEGE